ncbi:MAG: hypothetical protein WC211_04030 [Dehalococcoidia bacterium]
MPDRGEPSDRLQREIDEILSNIEQFPDAAQRKRRTQRRAFDDAFTRASARQREWVRSLGRVSLSQLMLLSFLMILGSFFFRGLVPIAWPWMMYAGVILFIVSFGLMTLGGGRNPMAGAPRQYWRGREVEYRSLTLSQRVRRWWGARRR